MNTQEQITLVQKIYELQGLIHKSNDAKQIRFYANQAIDYAIPVPANNPEYLNYPYRTEGKSRSLKLLQNEANWINDDEKDLDSTKFQLSMTFAMLSLNFIQGGVYELNRIVGIKGYN